MHPQKIEMGVAFNTCYRIRRKITLGLVYNMI